MTGFLNQIIENVKICEVENGKNEIITGLTKNTISFLFSFLDDRELNRFNKIRNYVSQLAARYRFGHARKIKLDNTEK